MDFGSFWSIPAILNHAVESQPQSVVRLLPIGRPASQYTSLGMGIFEFGWARSLPEEPRIEKTSKRLRVMGDAESGLKTKSATGGHPRDEVDTRATGPGKGGVPQIGRYSFGHGGGLLFSSQGQEITR